MQKQAVVEKERVHQISLLAETRFFTLEQATEILPLIYRITEDAQKKVKKQTNRIDAVKGTNPLLAIEAEQEIDQIVNAWRNKISRLGAVPKGAWLADFDNGQGYYCWKYPETEIRFFHGYKDGFSGRIEIQ